MKKREKEKKRKKEIKKKILSQFFPKMFLSSLPVIPDSYFPKTLLFCFPSQQTNTLKIFPSQFFPKMFLSTLPVLPKGYFLKCYSFVTPHSRRPILRKFFQHNFFSKMFLSSLPVLPCSYFSFHLSLSPTKSKFSKKNLQNFLVFFAQINSSFNGLSHDTHISHGHIWEPPCDPNPYSNPIPNPCNPNPNP